MSISSKEVSGDAIRQQAFDWLTRLRADDLDEKDMVTFASWLAQGHAHSQAFAEAERLFADMVTAAKSPVIDIVTPDANKLNAMPIPFQRNHYPLPAVRRLFNWVVPGLAMAAVWLFAVLLVLPSQSSLLDTYLSDYHTNTGELREIQLADGSKLLLNTNSAVSIDFNASIRRLNLHQGQVRFTVAKDEQRPFEVYSGDVIIRALGTVFEVYKQVDDVSITVQEHAVAAKLRPEASNVKQSISINVQQGQQLYYQGDGTLPMPNVVELNQASAWQHHQLLINDRPLEELLEELGRYRVGRIFLVDEGLKKLPVTGVFSLNHPDEVLASVTKVLGLKETRLGPWWVLLHR